MASIKLDSVETDNLEIKDPFIYLMIPKKDLKLYSSAAAPPPPPPPKKESSPSKSLVPPPPPPKKGSSPSKSLVPPPPPPPPRGSSSIPVRTPRGSSNKGGKKQKYTRKLKKSNKRKSRRGRR